MKAGDETVPLYVRLTDRFGDYGLISVVVLEVRGDEARLPLWLMSCRVLSRGVEHHVMNRVVASARDKGAKRVIGEYIPSAKNGMVKEFYSRFGFALVGETAASGASGATEWAVDVDAYEPTETLITDTPDERKP
jgi:FkbH-like protein